MSEKNIDNDYANSELNCVIWQFNKTGQSCFYDIDIFELRSLLVHVGF